MLSCGDGVEAISQFTAHAPHIELVITDVDMPPFGGAVLARVMLQLRPDLRLIAMSGLSSGEVADSDIEMIKKLAHAFLSKPFAPEDLLGTVHRLLHPSFKP